MKKNVLLLHSITVLFIVFLSNIVNGQILVSGTSFDPIPGKETNAYIGILDISQIGFQPSAISSTPALAPNVNTGVFYPGTYYAVTPDPNRLDNANKYINMSTTPDYMYVYGGNANSGSNFLQFSVGGMLPGATVRVDIDYVNVSNPAGTCGPGNVASFKVAINKPSNNPGTEVTQVKNGISASVSITDGGAVVDASGNIVVGINPVNGADPCKAIGIKSIKIYSTPFPNIISTAGNQVCVGDQITLQTTSTYNGTYQWQVDNGSGTFTNIAGATNQAALYQLSNTAATYKFRCQITPLPSGTAISSNVLTVTSIICCVDPVTNLPTSRKVIYIDDFGTLDLSDVTGKTYKVWDYSVISNPVLVTKTTTTPFRWPLSPAPLGATFQATGPLSDGQYAVAAYLTNGSPDNGYAGAQLSWAADIGGLNPQPTVGLDHSGTKAGACLLINCPAGTQGQAIYKNTINGLCTGKELSLECWINVFTMSSNCATYAPVNVTVRLTEVGNPGNVVTIPGVTATNQAGGGGAWVPVNSKITLTTGSSLLMEIINNSAESTCGNDLVLDDIKILACSPPALNLYFDIPTLSTQEDVCSSQMDLNVKPSTLLNSFYGGAPKFLYQWSRTPTVLTSWINLNTPQAGQTFSVANPSLDASFAGVADGGTVYFRAIATTTATFAARNNFTGANYANDNDPCKNYSVSSVIVATVKCPKCSKPTVVTITTPASTPASICQGTGQTLAGSATVTAASLNGGFKYSWFKTVGSGASTTVPLTTGSATLTVNTATAVPSNTTSITGLTTDAGTYVLRVEDGSAGNSSCYTEASVVLTVNPKPTITSAATGTVCSGIAQNYAITSSVASSYSWTRAAVTNITPATAGSGTTSPITETLTNSTAAAINVTYVITPTSTTGSCVGVAFNYVVTVNPSPVITSSATGTICSGVAQAYAITSNVPSSYAWSRAPVANVTPAAAGTGTTTPITETLTLGAAVTTPTTVTYVLTPTSTTGSCAGPPSNYAVTVNPAPKITSGATGTVCSGIAQSYAITSNVPSGYAWSRAAVTGITPATGSGTTSPITETLTNAGSTVLTVTYVITPTSTTGTCAGTPFNYVVTVNPVPTISSAATGTICSGVAQSYAITSVVPSSYSWTRAVVTNITPGTAGSGTTTPITETLTLGAGITTPTNVTYIITPTSTTGSCLGTPFNYVVTVNPKPVITSSPTGTVCSGVAQNYAITSNVVSTYSWTRAAVAGVNAGATGSGTTSPITEALTLGAAVTTPTTVTYVITPTAGCAGTAFNYVVTVNPSPVITSSGTGTICTGIAQNYTITSNIASSYSWTRASVAGITPATGSGTTSPITETLTNGGTTALTATYVITPTATTGTCAGTPFNYVVTVNPKPAITSSSTGNVCSGVAQNYAITSNVASTYSWSRAAVTNVAPAVPGAGTGTPITETLTLAAGVTSPTAVTYVITPTSTAGTCAGTAFNYVVTVNPKPTITSSSSGTTCTAVALNYLITSDVASVYSWTRSSVAGITPTTGSGTSNPITEILTGSGTVVYVITPTSTAGTCAGTPFNYTVVVSGTAVPTVTLTTNPGTTICAGTPVTFTATPTSGGNAVYAWSSSVNGPLAPTTDTYSSSSLVNNEVITVVLTSDLGCANPKTATASKTMTVNANVVPAVSVTANPSTAICPGANVTFTAAPTNGGTATYQWYKGTGTVPGTLITAETNATYSTTGAANGDNYYVVMTSTATCASPATATSIPVSVTVTPVPTIGVSITQDFMSICANNTVTFTATATGSGADAGTTYEWFIGPSTITTAAGGTTQEGPSTTATSFATSALTAANNKVYVQVVSHAACALSTTVGLSNVLSTTVNTGISPGSIGTDQQICSNGTVSGISQTAASDAVTASYVWQESGTPSDPASWITASGTPTGGGTGFTPAGAKTADVYYRRVVTDASAPAPCNTATSNVIHITVLALPNITSAPTGTICSGASQNYVITSDIASGYSWSRAAVSGVNGNAAGSGTSSPITESLTLAAGSTSPVNVVYSIVPKSITGSCTGPAFTYTVTVNPTPHITSPASDVICSGVAQGYPITSDIVSGYSWSRASVAGITNPGVTGQTSNPITEALVNTSNPQADIVVNYVITPTSTTGSCAGPSFTYALKVAVAATPTVVISTPTTVICVGRPVTFTAVGTAGGNLPSYQWYQSSASNPAGVQVGTNSTSYTTNTLASSMDEVWVVMTSNLGCITVNESNIAKSNNVSITVKQIPAPAISDLVKDICSAEGGYTFTGINTNPGSTYQWQYNARDIAGATDQTYFATKGGSYTLAENNGTCTNVSDPATLNIVESPVAYAGSDLYVTEGTFVQLQAGGGTTGTVYAWTPATGLTSTTVNNPSFKADNTITYTVTLTNTGGATNIQCTDHSDVTITVVKPIVVPNVITVNGDGSNDTWNILHIEGYPNATFEIYNRWGNLVWKSTGYPKQWDGTNFRNGEVLPDGTYFYIINLHSQIFTEPYTGWIQIVK